MIYVQSVTRPLAPVEIVSKLHEVVEALLCRNSLSSHKVTKPRALVAMHYSVIPGRSATYVRCVAGPTAGMSPMQVQRLPR
jgi:hypothetical protein